MSDKWETNVGQLRIVGGVRQTEAMNLAVIERRPILPIKSRGKGQLNILVELSGDTFGREEVCQDLTSAIADEYFGTPGTITYGLRQALLLANAQLLRYNARTVTEHRVGGAACVVLRNGDVYIAQAGWPMVYLVQRERVQAFPDTTLDVEDSSVLGERQIAEVRLFHASIQPGDTILLVDGPMARQLGSTRIGQIVSGNMDRALLNLETLAPPEDCTALVIQIGAGAATQGEREQWTFTPVERPGARGPVPGGGKPAASESRTRDPGRQPEQQPDRAVVKRAAQEEDVQEWGIPEQIPPERVIPEQSRPLEAAQARAPADWAEPEPEVAKQLPPAYPSSRPPVDPAVPDGQIAAPSPRRLAAGRAAYRRPPASRATPDLEPEEPSVGERVSALLGAMGRGLRTLGVRMLPDRPLPTATERRRAAARKQQREAKQGSRMWILAALAIPLVALLIVGGYSAYRDWSSRTQFETKLDAVQLERDLALSNAGNPPEARQNWEQVIVLANEAAGMQPENEDIQNMLAQAASAIDRIDGVTRLASPIKLYAYTAPDSQPSRVIVSGLDVYVLDRGAGQVYHHALNEVSSALRNPEDSQILMRETQPIEDRTLGMLVDIAWRKEGDDAQRGTLLVVDRNGLLVEFDPSWEQKQLQVLGGKDVWRDPVALATFDRNLYLLDPVANQIYKYPDKQFDSAPLTWMQAEGDLGNAFDLGIDGSIYVVHDSGKIDKYFGGEPAEFSVQQIPKPLLGAAALYMDIEEIAEYIYVADASDQRIVQLKRDGAFVRQFRPPPEEEAIFDGLSGLFVDERAGKLYYTADKALYVNDLPPVPH